MVAEEILKLNPDAKAAELAEKVLTSAGVKFKDDKKGETKDKKAEALFFMSAAQAKALAEIAVSEGTADKEACKKALKNNPSVDIALFGRMVASELRRLRAGCAQHFNPHRAERIRLFHRR